MTSPFYFAWVEGDQRTFTPAMKVTDEIVFSFTLKHDEAQLPTLDIEIMNPRVGLLNLDRKKWAWLGYEHPTLGAIPLFFGHIVGIPTNIFSELVTLQFIAMPPNYIEAKQAVAETMKVRPYYDPIWLDESHRDDVDAILEGWSHLWHVDRTTLEITSSDILTGEDGVVTFTEDQAVYKSLGVTVGEPPLTNIQIVGSVRWTQRYTGFIGGPTVNIDSYTGESFMRDWPKAGAGLGGGWRVQTSFVNETYSVVQTPQMNWNYSWNNPDKNPDQCAIMSVQSSGSAPALLSPFPIKARMVTKGQTGYCDPFSDPPSTRPLQSTITGIIVPLWNLNCVWSLRYDARRQFSETVAFPVKLNVQSVLTFPTVTQHTELMNISSVDIGEPLLQIEAWSDFDEQPVELGQIIFPNNPTLPGGLSYQICVVAGIAGTTEPNFSDFAGTLTVDGTVQWASMGSSPLLNQPDWSPASFVPLGEIICFRATLFNDATGEFEELPGRTSYYICTRAGQTNRAFSTKTYVPRLSDSDEVTPAPVTISYIARPAFTQSIGAHVTDGSVQWTSLGLTPALLGIPVGGTAGAVPARSFFPTTRGRWALEYLMCKARARLRKRSRAVKVSWDCPFDLAVSLSCRKNATVYDPRLPGAVATGKIVSYSLKANGDTGKLIGHVEIGCSIGYGNSVSEITGTPQYCAASGYMQPGYQQYDGGTTALPDGDIGYTPPKFSPFDDGLSFPLRRYQQVSDGGHFSGDLETQHAAIEGAIPASRELAMLNAGLIVVTDSHGRKGSTISMSATPDGAWAIEQMQRRLTSQGVPATMERNPISWNIEFLPVTNGPFSGAYSLRTDLLEVPKGIDLEAQSS